MASARARPVSSKMQGILGLSHTKMVPVAVINYSFQLFVAHYIHIL